MKPYYRESGIVIYHGDCREILQQIEKESVDLVLIDPPYGVSYISKRRTPDGEQAFSPIAGDKSLNTLRDAIPLMDRALKELSHAYIFVAPMKIGEATEAIALAWQIKNVLVWDKGNMGGRGDCQAGYSPNWEALIYCNKGRKALNGPRPKTVIRYDWSANRDPVHPTVKPRALMELLISKSTAAGDLVLDCFMGSGPTLRAAQALGRRAIGIDIDERNCETAANRLRQKI